VNASPAPATAIDPSVQFADLLVQAGFRIRGRRADCPHCGGQGRTTGTVAFTPQVAFCHRCKWTRNFRTLSRDLGVTVKTQSREWVTLRSQETEFATWLEVCHWLLMRLYWDLKRKADLAARILVYDTECAGAWNALAAYYHERSSILAALDFLSFEKNSLWLAVPMTRRRLFEAFVACEGRRRLNGR
jgi:hypothetical protein